MRIITISAAVVLAVLWVLYLRPVDLGGPTGYIIVDGTSMQPTFYTNDVVLTRKQKEYAPGDVVAFKVPEGDEAAGRKVIHRVIGGNGRDGYILQGDNRPVADPWHPTNADVIGKQWLAFPDAAKYVNWLRSPATIFAAGILVAALILMESPLRLARRRHRLRGPALGISRLR